LRTRGFLDTEFHEGDTEVYKDLFNIHFLDKFCGQVEIKILLTVKDKKILILD